MGYRCARTGDWKFIHYVDLDGMDELYNLREDPVELKNLVTFPGVQNTREHLKRELVRLLKDSN